MALILTRRQEEILNFIRKSVRDKGYPPTVREIGEAVGLASTSTVFTHLENLQKKGYLRRDPTKPRAVELLDLDDGYSENERPENNQTVYSPIVGCVTAGQPILAIENIESYFPLPRNWVNGEKVFMLKVQGTSMIEAGILDGDYIIVARQDTAQNGDIVIAMTEDDEATYSYLYSTTQSKEGHCILL